MTKIKMSVRALANRIRAGLSRHGLNLGHRGYFDVGLSNGGTCCAIGAALAYSAKNRKALLRMTAELQNESALSGREYVHARAAAKILNHGLTERDMVMLEAGFEDYCKDREFSGYGWRATLEKNPYFRLGQKLRKEA